MTKSLIQAVAHFNIYDVGYNLYLMKKLSDQPNLKKKQEKWKKANISNNATRQHVTIRLLDNLFKKYNVPPDKAWV